MDRLKDSGITAVRSMFRSTYACPEGEFTGWDWNSPTMQAMYKAAEELKKRNIDVMLTCGWLIEYFAPDKFPAGIRTIPIFVVKDLTFTAKATAKISVV